MRKRSLNSPEFLADLAAVDQWLTLRGFNKSDRFRHYKKVIEEMVAREQRSSPVEIYREIVRGERSTEIFTAHFECLEFVRALKTLVSNEIEIPYELLKRVLDGPWDASLEDHRSSHGRNATFELVIGAVAAHQKLQPILRTTNPDVEFEFRSRRVMMECKRIFTIKRLTDNLSEAIRQLTKCVDVDHGDIGLVAVSVSRLAHQGQQYFEAASEDAARAFLASELRRLVADFEKKLEEMSRPWVAGIIFYVSCPTYIQDEGFTVLSEGMVYRTNISSRDVVQDLVSVLRI